MSNIITSTVDAQTQRLEIKTQLQQLQIAAESGAGLSTWEAKALVDIVDETLFQNADLFTFRPGQTRYSCVVSSEPAGKPLNQCQMTAVCLTLFDHADHQDLSGKNNLASIELRRRRLLRITDEAREQGGLLSQEDLAELLMCNTRTIRRDIADLKASGIVVPTRGTVKDIGPGVTHKAVAIRLWLEGKEPMEVARQIHHSLKATENYLEKFKRVVYLGNKGFTIHEMARTIGISTASVNTFKDIHNEFRNKSQFKHRMEEINIVGKEYWQAEDEKKSSVSSRKYVTGK